MPGILSWGAHVPYRRLDLGSIAPVAGVGGGRGFRTVAAFDEDTTTMAVEASRRALRATPAPPRTLWFATVEPPYFDKSNATVAHAALQLPRDVGAFDLHGSVRSAVGALRAGLDGREASIVVAGGIRTGLPGSSDEATGGDGAAALVTTGAADHDHDLAAELIASASVSEEFVDRWRIPGERRSRLWEERFGEMRYVELGVDVWRASGLDLAAVDRFVLAGPHLRARTSLVKRLGIDPSKVVATLDGSVGNTGAADALLGLAASLDEAAPGDVIALISLADGADVFAFRATEAIGDRRPAASVASQIVRRGSVEYGKFLTWRGMLDVEPPRRPEPNRPSSSASARNADWKYAFVGSQGADGRVHLPPSPLDAERRPMSDARGTVVTFTVDRLAYSPSPPIVFAVVDFDGGGRLPVELTDVDPGEIGVGARVEMTFRRLFTADGIHNYFWKARPVR